MVENTHTALTATQLPILNAAKGSAEANAADLFTFYALTCAVIH
jgi:hypothetical protein